MTFPLTETDEVVLLTSGSYWYYDTILKLFDEDKIIMELNDDFNPGNHLYSKIDLLCGGDALEPDTYFIKVYCGFGAPGYLRNIIPDYNISFTASPCP